MSKSPQTTSRSPSPSTPPFLNIASPDFRSYKSFFQSPVRNSNNNDENLEGLQLSEMDFESAYAILTKSPTFNTQLSPLLGSPQPILGPIPSPLQHPVPLLPDDINSQTLPFDPNPNPNQLTFSHQSPRTTTTLRHNFQFSNFTDSSSTTTIPKSSTLPSINNIPIANTAQLPTASASPSVNSPDMLNELRQLQYRQATAAAAVGQAGAQPSTPPSFTFPNLSPYQQNAKLLIGGSSPLENMADLESLQYFDNVGELLSVNETNALEKFLDSIIDDKKIKTEPLMPEESGSNLDSIPVNNEEVRQKSLSFDNAYERAMKELESDGDDDDDDDDDDEGNDSNKGNEAIRLGSPLITSITQQQIPKRVSTADIDDSLIMSNEEPKRERKKRKVLSEEQKKLNHTTSEQRRRGTIKEAFDDLLKLLPSLTENVDMGDEKKKGSGSGSKRKNLPKSVVLERAAFEIERLLSVNNELKRLLNETS